MDHMRAWVRLSAVFLLLPAHRVAAEDMQQMISSLPDEAAECRYLESLWQSASDTLAGMQQLRIEGEDLAAGGSWGEAAEKMHACETTAATLTTGAMLKVTAAARVIENKHGTLPTCAAQFRERGQKGVREATTLGSECALRAQFLAKGPSGGKEPFAPPFPPGVGAYRPVLPPLGAGGRIR